MLLQTNMRPLSDADVEINLVEQRCYSTILALIPVHPQFMETQINPWGTKPEDPSFIPVVIAKVMDFGIILNLSFLKLEELKRNHDVLVDKPDMFILVKKGSNLPPNVMFY